METKIGFLENYNQKAGLVEKSNSRLIANIIIGAALLFCTLMILTGCWVAYQNKELGGLMAFAAAVGTTFVTIGGSAMYFLFNQKQTETKEDQS